MKNIFQKLQANESLIMALFTNLPRIVKFTDFSPSSFKLKRGILPLLTKYVSLLENYLSYQAKIFLVNLTPKVLLAKYLISVAAPLKGAGFKYGVYFSSFYE